MERRAADPVLLGRAVCDWRNPLRDAVDTDDLLRRQNLPTCTGRSCPAFRLRNRSPCTTRPARVRPRRAFVVCVWDTRNLPLIFERGPNLAQREPTVVGCSTRDSSDQSDSAGHSRTSGCPARSYASRPRSPGGSDRYTRPPPCACPRSRRTSGRRPPASPASDSHLREEWLVTNGLGGYASGTVTGAITRRYHGLLIAAFPIHWGA
jgi:hypothetical protein